MTRNREMVFGIVIILFSIGLFVLCGNVRDFTNSSIDAAFLPRIAAGMLLLLGLSTVYSGRRLASPQATPTDGTNSHMGGDADNQQEEGSAKQGFWFVLASMALMVGYVACLDTLGFVICSVVYILCQILLLRKQAAKRWLLFLSVAFFVPVVAYLLFVYAFEVMVPAGILG